ncbi:hypothetical protein Peur_022631 [Populus x canadensis]
MEHERKHLINPKTHHLEEHPIFSCLAKTYNEEPVLFSHALTTVWVLLWKFFNHSLDRWLEFLVLFPALWTQISRYH